MPGSHFFPLFRRPIRGGSTAERGLTLVEVMVSLGILVITSVGGVSGFVLLNQYAMSARNISSARALCQERIEEAQTLVFNPLSSTPSVPGQTINGTGSGPFNILGLPYSATGANYSSVGKFTGTAALATTTSEPVQVYVQQDGVTNTVAGVRTTTINLAPFTDQSANGLGASLNVVTFTVNVSYTFRNKAYSYSMYSLRSPD